MRFVAQVGARHSLLFLIFFVLSGSRFLYASDYQKGFSLTEIGEHKYDADSDDSRKTSAQRIVDRAFDLGARHIILTPRAVMKDPRGVEIVPMTLSSDRAAERDRYRRLVGYIHKKGMTVGIRPIFFVVDEQGRTPYVEVLPDGSKKNWWHGNIQPRDPNAWFESFKVYLDSYLLIAKIVKADEFTIGAELYSMTVGIEDQWSQYPHGFPGRWLELLNYVRSKLGANVRIMYDINFTDDKAIGPSVSEFGGELARWRYRIVDLAEPSDPDEKAIWNDLVNFWRGLDAIGIDMYRSIGSQNSQYDNRSVDDIGAELKETTDRYASQIDNALIEIESVVNVSKRCIFKEVGYRSVENGFLNPFEYASHTGVQSTVHQAAAYRAFFQSFHFSGLSWYGGVNFWDISVDESLHGPTDLGFSPLGKKETEDEIRNAFQF